MQRALLSGDDGGWPVSDDVSRSATATPALSAAWLWSKHSATVSQRVVTLLTLGLVLCTIALCAVTLALGLSLRGERSGISPPSPAFSPSSSSSSSSPLLPSSSSSSSTGSAEGPADAMGFALQLQLPDVMGHIAAFQAIANASGGSRAVSGPGYPLSVSYVVSALSGCTELVVRRQWFSIERWQVLAVALTSQYSGQSALSYDYGADFSVIGNSGRAGLTYDNASVVRVPHGGCAEDDWSLTAGVAQHIALVQRTDACTPARQAQLAVLHSAAGLLLYNSAANQSVFTTQAVAQYTPLPVFLVTYDVGMGFASASTYAGFTVRMSLTLDSTAQTLIANVIADTRTGDNRSTVVVGSHLDGVAAGAGSNDNASGTSANLAIALAVNRMIANGTWSLPNRLRFIWFGAEELGLYGSRYHVQQAALPDREPGESISSYAAMLNYDSIGSPNGYNAVYDATELPSSTPRRAVNGSRVISSVHFDYFRRQGLPYDSTGMGGGSDYVGFLELGVACGGLYGGLTEVKARELRDRYEAALGPGRGGIANAQLDPCYHRYCDDQQNINQPAYLGMVRAAAYTAATLALKTNLRAFLQYQEPAVQPPSPARHDDTV